MVLGVMTENIYYVYVYLNPLKKGKYSYYENGIGIDFDCEPFYVGAGKDKRLFAHLKEAKKENIKNSNKHKINTIKHILHHNLEPIIYKISYFENEYIAFNLEKFLIKLIGRSDKKLGSLTNLTDGGEGNINPSEESIEKQVYNYKKTLNNDPSIVENRALKTSQILKNDPSIGINQKIKEMETKKNNPEIMKNAGKKQSQTKKDNPEIMKNIKSKIKENWKNKSEKDKQIKGENIKIGLSHITEDERKIIDNKINLTKFKNKIQKGVDHPRYKKLDYEFLIINYFNIISSSNIIENYNKNHTNIKKSPYRVFLKIIGFPINYLDFRKPALKEIYLKFVKENKHKIQWYIDNYERLEKEYFEKKCQEKYKDFLNNLEKYC